MPVFAPLALQANGILVEMLLRDSRRETLLGKIRWHYQCFASLQQFTNYEMKEFCSYHLTLARIYVSNTDLELSALIRKCNSLFQVLSCLEKRLAQETNQSFQPDINTSMECSAFFYLGEDIGRSPSGLPCYSNVMKCRRCSYRHRAGMLVTCHPNNDAAAEAAVTTSPVCQPNDPVERDLQELLQMLTPPESELIPVSIKPEAKRPLDIIHCGFYRPIKDEATGKKYHMLVFLDEYTRFATPYFCTDNSPSTLVQKFKDFKAQAEGFHSNNGYLIKRVYTYRTPTYGGQFSDFLAHHSIGHSTRPAPLVRCLFESHEKSVYTAVTNIIRRARLTKHFCLYALREAVHVRNIALNEAAQRVPYIMWTGHDIAFKLGGGFGSRVCADTEFEWGINLGTDISNDTTLVLTEKNKVKKMNIDESDYEAYGYEPGFGPSLTPPARNDPIFHHPDLLQYHFV